MHKYIITGASARITSGVLELTADQAKARMHCLMAVRDGLFTVISPVEFKRGETIGFEGEITKVLADLIEPRVNAPKPSVKKKTDVEE